MTKRIMERELYRKAEKFVTRTFAGSGEEGALAGADDSDAGIGAHDRALRAAGAPVGVLQPGGMEAALVGMVSESHGAAGTDGNAEATTFADLLGNLYGDAAGGLRHGYYFVASVPAPPRPSARLPGEPDVRAQEQPWHVDVGDLIS